MKKWMKFIAALLAVVLVLTCIPFTVPTFAADDSGKLLDLSFTEKAGKYQFAAKDGSTNYSFTFEYVKTEDGSKNYSLTITDANKGFDRGSQYHLKWGTDGDWMADRVENNTIHFDLWDFLFDGMKAGPLILSVSAGGDDSSGDDASGDGPEKHDGTGNGYTQIHNFGNNYTIQIDIENIQAVLDGGYFDEMLAADMDLYFEIFVSERGHKIPAAFFNKFRNLPVSAYIMGEYSDEHGKLIEKYDWCISVQNDHDVVNDFNPDVDYEISGKTVGAYFSEDATFISIDANNDPLEYNIIKLSMNCLLFDGHTMKMSEIFKDFFEKYCVEEILDSEGIQYGYGSNPTYDGEIGEFYLLVEDEETGCLQKIGSDHCWSMSTIDGCAYVEMNEMANSHSSTFIISDTAAIGCTKEELVSYFKSRKEIKADGGVSEVFVETAEELNLDLIVGSDDTTFTIKGDEIDEVISFAPTVTDKEETKQIIEQVSDVTNNTDFDYIEFTNEYSEEKGVLPGTTEVTYHVDDQEISTGDTVSVYYVNPKDGLELVGTDTVDSKGNIDFELEHFSSYVVVKTKSSSKTAIKTVTLKKKIVAYADGKTTVSVVVKDAKGNKVPKSGYTVTYKNNNKVGVATVTVTGKGAYKGTISKKFTIVPKTTKAAVVTSTKSSITVKWKKISKQADGYQVAVAKNKKFTKDVKTKKITKVATVQWKNTGLKEGTTYYFRVRTYKKVNGKTYWSDWSDAVSAKAVTVVPKATKITKKTATKNSITLSWNKVTKVAQGYEISYSTSKAFKKNATVTKKVTSKSTNSLTIKKLKTKQTYYIRIRTYNKANKTTYYSKWSETIKVTTKTK